ncbi:MAG: hypothetical protein M1816_002707 [Peltula sp. TS41687]|nr:MAG: hypothetical protein M1816_002707 [Peltula sp. TS41687]
MNPVQKIALVALIILMVPAMVIACIKLLRSRRRRCAHDTLRMDDEEALRRLSEYRVAGRTWHGWKAMDPEGRAVKMPKRRPEIRSFSRAGRKISNWQNAVYPLATNRVHGTEEEEDFRHELRNSSTTRKAPGSIPQFPAAVYSRPSNTISNHPNGPHRSEPRHNPLGNPYPPGRPDGRAGRIAPPPSQQTSEAFSMDGSEYLNHSIRYHNAEGVSHDPYPKQFTALLDRRLNVIYKDTHGIPDAYVRDTMIPPPWKPGDPEPHDSDSDDAASFSTVIILTTSLLETRHPNAHQDSQA